jgi:trehalose-phosphatase
LALFLDFDGTLVPLRRRPTDVKPLGLPLRRILHRLIGHRYLNVYVISGRPLRELPRLIRVPGVRLLGLHGWEGQNMPQLDEERGLLQVAKQRLDQRLPKTRQIWLEDKGLGLAVHYRGARPSVIRLARAVVEDVLKAVEPQLHIVQGHKVWELLPQQIDGKGPVAVALLSQLPPSTLPIVVGDDTTDESAFWVLRGGVTIHVGASHHTRARFLLRNPEEVKMFLLKLEAAVA